MSQLDPPALKPVPTAPHSRVHHIFYLAPYIQHLFADFLEAHPTSSILESDALVDTLSRIYVLGLKYTPTFWQDAKDVPLPKDEEEMLAHLNLLRAATSKLNGRRPWEYFQPLWNRLTHDPLPSRKAKDMMITFNETEAETQVRIRLIRLVIKLVEAEIHPPERPPPPEPRPRRIVGRLSRRNKSEP